LWTATTTATNAIQTGSKKTKMKLTQGMSPDSA